MKRQMKKMIALLLTLTLILGFSIQVYAEETPVVTSVEVSEDKVIEILSFNDFHGALGEGSKDLGYAKLVGFINSFKAEHMNTLVVSAGDNYNGTALSNLTLGEPVNEMFKSVDMIASAVGNHEFDWGKDLFDDWSEQGGFPFIASNIYDEATGELVDFAEPYLITEVDGVKIAFIGIATPETEYKSLASSVEGLEFRDPIEASQTWIDYLKAGKAEEGVPDVILALTHLGAFQDNYGSNITDEVSGESAKLAAGVTGLDGIFTGHTHTSVQGYVNGVAIVQGYKQGRSMSRLTITVNDDGVTVVPELLNLYEDIDTIVADETAEAAYNVWNDSLAPTLNEVLGQATEEVIHDRYGDQVTPLGKWACEVMAEAVDAQIAFQNGGGLRTSIPAGDVTVGLLYQVMPYDNTLVTMDLLGSDVLKNIEHGLGNEEVGNGAFSGVTVAYDMDKEFGSRVVSITLPDGTPLDMDAYYSVVVNNFQATDGDNYMFEEVGLNQVDTYIPVRTVLMDAVKANNLDGASATNIVDVDTYTVQTGDVLWKIAKKFGTTYQELGLINKLKNVNLIYSGDMLYVPVTQ